MVMMDAGPSIIIASMMVEGREGDKANVAKAKPGSIFYIPVFYSRFWLLTFPMRFRILDFRLRLEHVLLNSPIYEKTTNFHPTMICSLEQAL